MPIKYRKNLKFRITPGFTCDVTHVEKAAISTNDQLSDLPFFLFKIIDYKTTSAIIGRLFCDNLAKETKSQVNPIEKGHPDIIPKTITQSKTSKDYPKGIEVKVTIGSVEEDSKLSVGDSRIDKLVDITWQAHHNQVTGLMGIVWDFNSLAKDYPVITGVFYTNNLEEVDWGKISGITGRSTKVTAMLTSGKKKMGKGNVIILDDEKYLKKYQMILNFNLAN